MQELKMSVQYQGVLLIYALVDLAEAELNPFLHQQYSASRAALRWNLSNPLYPDECH